jgi:hypothetical protein
LCIEKCNQDEKSIPYLYFKVKSDWVYALTVPSQRDVTPDVNHVSLCLVSKIFNPDKYKAFLNILIEQYVTTGDPTKVLEGVIFCRILKYLFVYDFLSHRLFEHICNRTICQRTT